MGKLRGAVESHAPDAPAHKTPISAGHNLSDTDLISPVPDPLSEPWDTVNRGPKGDSVVPNIEVLGANLTAKPAGI
jgi:hypothetical protein